MPIDYVITIRGHLDDHWSAWFDGLTIANGTNGEATLTGPLTDQASLHGVLIKIRDLGLPLIAIMLLAPQQMASPAHSATSVHRMKSATDGWGERTSTGSIQHAHGNTCARVNSPW